MQKILTKVAFYPLNLILSLLVIIGCLAFAIIAPNKFLNVIKGIVDLLEEIKKLDNKMDEITVNQVAEWRNNIMN